MVDVALTLFFAAWLLATALNAGRPGARVIGRLGPFGYLVPVWNFFAPTPATHDYQVLYRDGCADGSVSRWREVPRWFDERPLVAPLWNPRKVYKKTVFDLAMALDRETEAIQRREQRAEAARLTVEDRAALHLSIPYLHLLTFVSSGVNHADDAVTTQFVVVRLNDMRDEAEPVFVSDHHRLVDAATANSRAHRGKR